MLFRPIIHLDDLNSQAGKDFLFDFGILEEIVGDTVQKSPGYLDSPVRIEGWKVSKSGEKEWSCILPAYIIPPVLNGLECTLEQLSFGPAEFCSISTRLQARVRIDYFDIASRTPDAEEIRTQTTYLAAMMDYLTEKMTVMAQNKETQLFSITLACDDFQYEVPNCLLQFVLPAISRIVETGLAHQEIGTFTFEEMKKWKSS